MSKSEQFLMHLDNLNAAIRYFDKNLDSGLRDLEDPDWIVDKAIYDKDKDEVFLSFKEKKMDRWWRNE